MLGILTYLYSALLVHFACNVLIQYTGMLAIIIVLVQHTINALQVHFRCNILDILTAKSTGMFAVVHIFM